MEYVLKGKVELDTKDAERSMNSFVNNMNQPLMAGNNTTPAMANAMQQQQQTFQNSNESMSDLNDVMSKLKDSFKDVLGSIKSLAGDLDSLDTKLPNIQKARKDATDDSKKELQQNIRGVNGVLQAGSNTITYLTNGDAAGATIGAINGLGQTLTQKGTQSNIPGLAKGLLVGGGLATATALLLGAGNKMASAYSESLDSQDALLQAFGGEKTYKNNKTTNALISLDLLSEATNWAKGTGLRIDDYVNLATNLKQYGINDSESAFNIATQSAMWQKYTGADVSQVSNFAGMIERYGGNGTMALQNAYGALRASGLEKEQYSEFLTGLQNVVENGISKGFIKSTDDVSEQLANISMLSGNSQLWSGLVGSQKYQQIGSAMSNATSLNSTSSMLLYQAMAGTMGDNASWVDVMSKIEEGAWGDTEFMQNYAKILNNAYGNDKASKIATIRENFGTNWTEANQMYDIFYNVENKTPEQLQSEMKKYQSSKVSMVENDTSTMADALNALQNDIAQVSRDTFLAKYGSAEVLAGILDGVVDIKDAITGKKGNIVNGINYNEASAVRNDTNLAVGVDIDFLTLEDLKKEAKNGEASAEEEEAYKLLSNAKFQGIEVDTLEKFLQMILDTKISGEFDKKGGRVFDTDALKDVLIEIRNKLENMNVYEE